MNPLRPFDQAVDLLPFGIRQLALSVPRTKQMIAEEIRLRAGRPVSITFPDGEEVLPGSPVVTTNDLRTVLEIATQASAHTALEHVRQGYVTVRGGHRLGLCGNIVCKDGRIHNLRCISSLNIRIARQITGIGNDLLRRIRLGGKTPSTLVIAPPGAGKTTLLRDLIRGISYGVGGAAMRVGVADERGELGAMWDGVPQMDLGPQTDIVDGCSKADGLLMLLRGMNPQVLAVDEITAPCDVEALQVAIGCGVSLLATVHGTSAADCCGNLIYKTLLDKRMFHYIVRIMMVDGVRKYQLEEPEIC